MIKLAVKTKKNIEFAGCVLAQDHGRKASENVPDLQGVVEVKQYVGWKLLRGQSKL